MKTTLRLVLLALGVAAFGWFLSRAGLGEIAAMFRRLGWSAPLILLPYLIVYVADTLGWRFAFGRAGVPQVPFVWLYRIRWCGEAVNNVVPSVWIGGEATKVYLLHKRGVDPHRAAASVINGRTIQSLTQVVFLALGSAAFLHVAPPHPGLRATLAFILVGSAVAVAVLFWLQSHGLFSVLFRVTSMLRIRLKKLEAARARLVHIDALVMDFYRTERRHLAFSAAAYLGGWLLDTVEIFLVAHLLDVPMTWLHALAIEAFVGLAKILGLVVPGAIGVQESGIALVCQMAGLPGPFGVTYAVLRRGREVLYAALGWFWLYLDESSLKGFRERLQHETKESL